jgi:predicted Zn finger-like uncharacterized protein
MVLSVRRKEMTEITKCPSCSTRFKVTDAQLDAHDGLVRCGHCHDIFDARKYLHDDEPSRQLSLPIGPEFQTDEPDLTPIPDIPQLEAERKTLAQQVEFVEELTDEVMEQPRRKTNWVGVLLVSLLVLTLLAQATYYYRVDLGARLPGLKPLLAESCAMLDCTVALPQKADLIAIESSELESDPEQSNVVTLHVLVHNRAPFTQALPSLEFTLTDMQDKAVARRVFHPVDYLKSVADEKLGVLSNRDLDIRLRLDTTELKPSGYRLFLFYPK